MQSRPQGAPQAEAGSLPMADTFLNLPAKLSILCRAWTHPLESAWLTACGRGIMVPAVRVDAAADGQLTGVEQSPGWAEPALLPPPQPSLIEANRRRDLCQQQGDRAEPQGQLPLCSSGGRGSTLTFTSQALPSWATWKPSDPRPGTSARRSEPPAGRSRGQSAGRMWRAPRGGLCSLSRVP